MKHSTRMLVSGLGAVAAVFGHVLYVVGVIVAAGLWGVGGGGLSAVAMVAAWLALPGLVACWCLAVRRSPRAAGVAAVALACAVVPVAVWLERHAGAGHTVLRHELDEIELPEGLERVDDEEYGSPICFDDCASVVRTYRVDGSVAVVVDDVERALAAQGFVTERPYASYDGTYGYGDALDLVATRERFDVWVSEQDGRLRITIEAG